MYKRGFGWYRMCPVCKREAGREGDREAWNFFYRMYRELNEEKRKRKGININIKQVTS